MSRHRVSISSAHLRTSSGRENKSSARENNSSARESKSSARGTEYRRKECDVLNMQLYSQHKGRGWKKPLQTTNFTETSKINFSGISENRPESNKSSLYIAHRQWFFNAEILDKITKDGYIPSVTCMYFTKCSVPLTRSGWQRWIR